MKESYENELGIGKSIVLHIRDLTIWLQWCHIWHIAVHLNKIWLTCGCQASKQSDAHNRELHTNYLIFITLTHCCIAVLYTAFLNVEGIPPTPSCGSTGLSKQGTPSYRSLPGFSDRGFCGQKCIVTRLCSGFRGERGLEHACGISSWSYQYSACDRGAMLFDFT